jgi:hypothetical protein
MLIGLTRRVFSIGLLMVLSIAGILTVLPAQSSFPCSASQSSFWQICGPIESPSGTNTQPSVIQANDGTMGMAWGGHPSSGFAILYAAGVWNATSSSWNWNTGSAVANKAGTNQNPTLVQLTNSTMDIFFSYKSPTSQNFQLYFVSQSGGLFSKQYFPVPLANPTPLNDTFPSATVGPDGTLWLVWTRDNTTRAGNAHVMRQLWYKTFKGDVWSTEQPLTSANDSNWNLKPSVMVGRDGIVRVVFSKGISTNFQLEYMTYNGSVWSSPIPLTTQTTTVDTDPSIMQDRNGTLWVFWDRNVISGTNSNHVIYDRSSIDNGATWASETGLTPTTCTTYCVDSQYPSAVQSTTDKNIWVFYFYNPVMNFDIYGLKTSNPISPVHDVVISYFSPNASSIYAGGFREPYTATGIPIFQSAVVQVLVAFQNIGDFSEAVTLTLTVTNTTSYTLPVQILPIAAGSSSLAFFNFNSTGLRPARYGISGNASISGRTIGNRLDGLLFTPNLIHLLPLGDLDQDGSVTITDVSVLFYDYGFSCLTPATCSPRFQAAQWGDVCGHGTIDVCDVAVMVHNYGILT